jgi:hypothetical protein
MFPPRYHGTIFNVVYQGDPLQKTPVKAHVITSLDSAEVLSADWKSILAKFQPSDIERVENKKNVAVLTMKSSCKFTSISLTTKPDPCDNLVTALTQILSLPTPEVKSRAVSEIIPTFRLSDKGLENALYKAMVDQCSQLLQLFTPPKGSTGVNGHLVDVFSCVFRLRFPNEARPNDRNVSDVSVEIRRTMLLHWCNSLTKCLQPAETNSAKTFYARVALNCLNTIAKLGGPLGIGVEDLTQAVNQFSSSGEGDGIEPAILRITMLAQTELNNSWGRTPPVDLANLQVVLNLACLVLSGITIGMYDVDVDNLVNRIADFVKRVVEKERHAEAAKKELLISQTKFLRDMLCLLDGKRYDEPFQHVFCLWSLKSSDPTADQMKALETKAFDPKAFETKH